MPELAAVLFDLDGTLVDTAPDLGAAANRMRADRGLPAMSPEMLRPVASQGARGLLRVAFNLHPEDPEFAPMRTEFLETYAAHLCERSALFPGMTGTLRMLSERGIAWGIVTNKPAFLTLPLITALQLPVAPDTVVCGDTTARAKPDPLPIIHALSRMGVAAAESLMIGDDPRDMAAGQAAGARCWAAAWGYLEAGEHPQDWGAERVIDRSEALASALFQGDGTPAVAGDLQKGRRQDQHTTEPLQQCRHLPRQPPGR